MKGVTKPIKVVFSFWGHLAAKLFAALCGEASYGKSNLKVGDS